jgi:hypothetical protein
LAWSLEAAALAWIAGRTGSRWALHGCTAVFVLALARLAGVDALLRESVVLLNPRFLAFATTAAALLLAARWNRAALPAPGFYVAGHAILLWGLVLDALGWVSRTTAPDNLASARSTAVSILMAAYAVLLVALGVGRRSALDRILGLLLIAAIVAKLYLYDVWRISRGMYRVAAFAGLGVFLLITSYLYSRHRSSIESWWRDRS